MQKILLTYQSNSKPMLSQKAWLFSMIAGLLLMGCASHAIAAKQSALIHFEVHGKLGFSDGKKGGSANFMWIEDGKNFDIRLYGPFGAGAVWIQGMDNEIVLTDGEGKTFHGKTPEAVLKKATGWDIPVSGLRYWLKGIPAPHSKAKHVVYVKAEHQKNRPSHPLLEAFSQDGWSIDYQGYRQVKNQWVPKALVLQRGKIRLKVIFKQWDL